MQKKRSVYNIWSAKELQFESCQDVTRFVRRFIDSAITAAIKIAAVMALRNWMFHVDFIGLNREGTAEFYLYHVLWSIPTPAYPEPYVTVSVFFCIAASRVQPPHFPVDRGHEILDQRTIKHIDLLQEKRDDRQMLHDCTGLTCACETVATAAGQLVESPAADSPSRLLEARVDLKLAVPRVAPPPSPYMATPSRDGGGSDSGSGGTDSGGDSVNGDGDDDDDGNQIFKI
ncbi:hypothetical protein EAG_16364 [Camponotus floridanus]|uniref:Uncharacterized protein n=1 Tax=Camponotus floridanus TaxID=104421 RepID=E1ZZX4_CAMFO|nr:hypothetical protein EAG_16364 [Camponotus floridanus]